MTNSNCLEGIACPKCGSDSRFRIAVWTMAEVTDDGAETCGDMEWDADSYAGCPECGHHGTVGDFRLVTMNDNATTTIKE